MQPRIHCCYFVLGLLLAGMGSAAERLPGTAPLELPENLAAVHQQQVVDYFLQRIAAAEGVRDKKWKPDFASAESYEQSVETHRANCRAMLGLSFEPAPAAAAKMELLGESPSCRIERLSTPIEDGMFARGLVFTPKANGRKAALIVCGDADVWPEKLAGMPDGDRPAPTARTPGPLAARSVAQPPKWLTDLLARGAIVYLPQSVERLADHAYCKTLKGFDRRRVLYRLGYVVGRTMTGIDVREAVAAVDYLSARADVDARRIGMVGIGQGGMTALYTAAVERRVRAVAVAGYFQRRDRCYEEPIDRRLPRQLLEFGDAEAAALIAPRPLAVMDWPESSLTRERVATELRRAARLYEGLHAANRLKLAADLGGDEPLERAVRLAAQELKLSEPQDAIALPPLAVAPDAALACRDLHFSERLGWLRRLIDASEAKRYERWGLLARQPADFEKIKAEMLAEYRRLVGEAPTEGTPINPRTELALITDKYRAYRVMLDVAPGVEVYGNLLVPRHLQGRAAAVICQHGLNGLPEEITGLGQQADTVYHEFGRHLAERGYVVFAPLITHHYLAGKEPDRSSVMNRLAWQADAVGMMRVAMVVAKTNRVIDFLQSLPFVDGQHIGYHGLSYGGYSATWCAPLVNRLCATVISGNFNDRRAKLVSDTESTSYLLYPYEDMYYWDLLNRFTDPEQIVMAAPRAVCVEFGERDAITTPAWTAAAWKQTAAIRDRFGLTDRIELDHYDGVHEIHGIGAFDFLDRFLRPAAPVGRDYEYTLHLPPVSSIMGAFLTGQEPFVLHTLDARPESRLRGRFWIPEGARRFHGMAVKLSRVGNPGPLEARFGTAPGKDDLGAARLDAEPVMPLFEAFEELRVDPRPAAGGQLIYYELHAAAGRSPAHHYYVYGPKPLGGADWPDRFGLAFRVLTDRPQDALEQPGRQRAFQHIKEMLGPYYRDDPALRLRTDQPRLPNETAIEQGWSIHHAADRDGVLASAAWDLEQFLALRAGLRVRVEAQAASNEPKMITLVVSDHAELRAAIATDEGYRVEVLPDRVVVSGRTPRGVMRGAYWIEDIMRLRGGPYLAQGQTDRNCRFRRRLTRSVHQPKTVYAENSHPLVYSEGLLRHISHQGFNAVFVWTNLEVMTHESQVFPELNDPDAPANYARLKELVDWARPLGIDVFCHLATNHHHAVPDAFYANHPDCRGVSFANSMCTSNAKVREYQAESIRHLFQFAPGLKGVDLIYDCEGYMHCGIGNQKECPRCRGRKTEDIAAEALTNLYQAVKQANPDGEMIAWTYHLGRPSWIVNTIPKLPKGIIVQFDFSKGAPIERDGIPSVTGDYNITTLGPPQSFVDYYRQARGLGFKVSAKTEHCISQEFVTVPYIPCLRQWHDRAVKLAEFDLDGLFCNWLHYGYTPSRPAEILMWDSWTPAPPLDELLEQMARRDFGPAAASHVTRAWEHFTRGIRQFPYSNPVARYPGPLQKGPSQPLFLDPAVKNFGRCRAWQNDLQWTSPWGPAVTAKYFQLVETEFAAGIAELREAKLVADPVCSAALDGEIRIAETICRSLHTMVNLIRWIPVRDAYAAAPPSEKRERLRTQLVVIAEDELANSQAALEIAQADSRIGAASEGDGLQRGGVFTASLISRKIGMLEDMLQRDLDAGAK